MLYHITTAEAWAEHTGDYRPPSLESEGFIHLSFAQQRRLTQQRYYTEREGLILLRIDPAALPEPPRIENGFPHLYSSLPRAAVIDASPLAAYRDLSVALLSRVYPERDNRLEQDLATIRADLVVLPELPLNPWSPATQTAREDDVDDWRSSCLSRAAAGAGKAVLGGVIEATLSDTPRRPPQGGALAGRRNTAYLWGPDGKSCLRYEKMHLPHEPGFWETHHYQPGVEAPRVSDQLGFPLGVQLCSDTNRPFGSLALQAQGAAAIIIPRATEKATFGRWRRIFQALAQITACYVLSVNRPHPEAGVPLGGPSIVVRPDGEVLVESDDPVVHLTLEHSKVVAARGGYPGYLDFPLEVYASAWGELLTRG